MGTLSRFLLSVVISAAFELAFIELSHLSFEKPQFEIKNVIKISLIAKETQKVSLKVVKGKGKNEQKFEKFRSPKPKLKSRAPVKRVNSGKKKEKASKGGGLRPLEGNLPASYVESVKSAIEENVFYPLEAVEKGIEGMVMVKFTLNRQGKAVECYPLFGNPILSQATCIAIRKAKFPPIPENLKNKELHFQLQIEYNLKKPKI
jgi:TonB family protein